MNSTPQLDLHPDADSLNDFVEQALAAPKREQILTHLAACSRCRQVIYLAQKAAEAEAPAWATAARLAKPSSAWYGNWRLAWLPAAALAAALALVVTFYPKHTARAPELAKVAPESERAVPAPALWQPSAGAPPMPSSSIPAKSAPKVAQSATHRTLPEESAQEAAPVSAAGIPAEPGSIAFSYAENNSPPSPSMNSVHGVAQQQASTQLKPEPAVAAWQQEQEQSVGALSTNADAVQLSQKKMPAAMGGAHTSRTSSFATAAPRMAKQAAPASSFDTSMQPSMANAVSPSATKSTHLPSGLTIISTATAGHRTLAIDLAGALFLSDDTGQRWEQVPRQWTGRAIQVRVQSGVSSALFLMTSDNGSISTSADGKTWAAR